MKKVILVFIALFSLSFLNSCQTEDETTFVNTVSAVNNIVTVGTWKITNYNDSGTDKTAVFNGYNFTFGNNSVLTANNGTNNYTGSWSVTDSNSNDDSPSDLHFNISFAAPANFADLSDDWDIQERSANVIKLIDVSGGNGGTDYLVFTKN